RKSWYMAFFQLGAIADASVVARDFRLIERLWSDWSPGLPGCPYLDELKDCLRASMPAPIRYYRSLFWPPHALVRRMRGMRRIEVATLNLLGADDGCIDPRTGRGQERFFAGEFSCEVVAGAGHFLHLERHSEVVGRVVDWLSTNR